MQTKLTPLCLLIAIGLGFYCANMSRAVRRLREHTARLDEEASNLREHVGGLRQDRLLRDWLFERRGPTFQIPPSKGVQIRLVFAIDGKTDSIELLRKTSLRGAESEQEYTLLRDAREKREDGDQYSLFPFLFAWRLCGLAPWRVIRVPLHLHAKPQSR